MLFKRYRKNFNMILCNKKRPNIKVISPKKA